MKVIQTIQSIISDDQPVEVSFYTGDDHVQALAALVMAAAHEYNDSYYKVIDVRIKF